MLNLSETLSLPIQSVTETFAILGRRGTGKTSTAVVLVEEMLKAGQHVCVLDPVGVWHGLRSSRDGQSAGLPIVILGGQFADVPLPPDSGAEIAHLVAEELHSVVLDMSDFTQGEKARFVTAFAETLYRIKGRARQPLHIVVDEADMFTPQQPLPDEKRMLGAMDRIQRQGRVRGLGMTLISQRPAVVNKNVLTQTEVLITMQLTGPQDIKAIDDWISSQGTAEQRKELLASVTSLPVGTGWVCSPSFLNLFARVSFRPRETFDSSATPKVGEETRLPTARASIDLEALRARLSAAVENVAEEDPARLRARIAEMQRELAAARKSASAPEVKIERVEVPILPPDQLDRLSSVAEDVIGVAKDLLALGASIKEVLQAHVTPMSIRTNAPSGSIMDSPSAVGASNASAASTPSTASTSSAQPARPSSPGVTAPQQRILDALSWWESCGINAPTREQVAFLTSYSATSGTFRTYLSALRTGEFIDYPTGGAVSLTTRGREVAVPVSLPTTIESLHKSVFAKLTGPQRRFMEVLCSIYPREMSREDLGAAVELSPTSGTFRTYISSLRTLNLLVYPNQGSVCAADILFPKGLN